jgi:hypothetical protein
MVLAGGPRCRLWRLDLSACSVATPLCDQAALSAKEAKLLTAAQLYVQAQQQKEGQCADDGVTTVIKSHNDAFIDVTQGAAAGLRPDVLVRGEA